MTTINNDQSLIEKVGGIERAKEIVDGAPDWPVIGYCIVGNNYIFKQCEHAPCSYSNLENAWSEEYAIHFVSLDDLRTAIAKHDEFKVGDFVVLTATGTKDVLLKIIDHKYTNDLHRVKIVKTASCGPIHKDQIRHATLEEIKAGHRIDDTTDKVTEI
ncbi:hypothetical protein [Acinetobacter bereziniae]|uniref:hypothetical protein n=1 Tax=Acinetobacter bereziniae TaxID=106648 RepID=UPI001D0E223E|nr:hypothetical protein [Acinetobacter bereziniae]